jgi:hypothetical protein
MALSGFRLRFVRQALQLAALVLALGVAAQPAAGQVLELDGISLADVGLTERVVADKVSGAAIGGYDPVAYFTAGRAVAGSPDFQLIWNGAAWRFANAGNKAAFEADPTVYAPCFGGYDADAIGRGVATAGDPRIFAIEGEHLYLFRDPASRAHFLASSTRAAAAEAAWPAIETTLTR